MKRACNRGAFAKKTYNNRALWQNSSITIGLFGKARKKKPYNNVVFLQKRRFVSNETCRTTCFSRSFAKKTLQQHGSLAKEPHNNRSFGQRALKQCFFFEKEPLCCRALSIGLFCKRALQQESFLAKEPYCCRALLQKSPETTGLSCKRALV